MRRARDRSESRTDRRRANRRPAPAFWNDPRTLTPAPNARPAGAGEGPPQWFRGLVNRRFGRAMLTFLAAVIGLGLIVAVSGARFASEDIGTVGVVRNGGPFDNRSVRQVLMPGQRLTWIGLFSQSPHNYPASNVTQVYEVSSDPQRGAAASRDVFSTPTKDGVQMELEGALYLRFVGETDIKTLEAFDIGPGTRKFPASGGRELYPWQGSDGFSAMLSAMVRPVLDSDVRREVAQFQCAQLVASCAIVRRVVRNNSVHTTSSIALIEQSINNTLEDDLARTLGHRYFWDIRFRITRVSLPENVQKAVDEVQAQYAQVNGARAQVLQARFQNERNELLAKTYNRSPAISTIEALKAAPPKATIIINTGGGRKPSIIAGGN
jgi:regulator of protease activity HflC (stomatin/prohibitin superfamily)